MSRASPPARGLHGDPFILLPEWRLGGRCSRPQKYKVARMRAVVLSGPLRDDRRRSTVASIRSGSFVIGRLLPAFLPALGALWAPLAVLGLHLLSSRVLGLYERWPALDVPMHIAGGAAISYFIQRVLLQASLAGVLRAERWLTAALVLSLACTAAVFWEFAEFLADRYLGTHAQGGVPDTLGDIAIGIAGSAAFLGARALLSSLQRPGSVTRAADPP